jgi:hypothetical protein
MLLAKVAELEHVTFLQHPTAQPHSAQQDFFALLVDNKLILSTQETLGMRIDASETHSQ